MFSLSSEGQNQYLDTPEKLTGQDPVANKHECEQRISLLEAELRDLSERYLHLSLKHAKVKDQRE